MAVLEWPQHDPNERLDYYIDWTEALEGDQITSSAWSFATRDDGSDADGFNFPITLNENSFSQNYTGIWITGGVIGDRVTLVNRITTLGGRIMDQSVQLPIGEN